MKQDKKSEKILKRYKKIFDNLEGYDRTGKLPKRIEDKVKKT